MAAATTNPEKRLQLKLLVDTQRQRVLFAEANKDFVDFLCTLLLLPTGMVTKLLTSKAMVGSVGSLYQSIEDLNDTYLQPNLTKDTLLNPKSSSGFSSASPLSLPANNDTSKMVKKFYVCCNSGGGHRYVADDPKAFCPSCGGNMSIEVPYVAAKKAGAKQGLSSSSSSGGGEGYVKDVVTYMVMDDLQVKPLSVVSTLALLTKHQTSSALEEKTVSVGIDEVRMFFISILMFV